MGGDESDPGRRRWLRALVAGTAAVTFSSRSSAMPKNTADKFIVFVFGDSILDGARNKNFNRMNAIIAELALRYGELADIHAHFLGGDPCSREQSSQAFGELQRFGQHSCPRIASTQRSNRSRRAGALVSSG